MKISIWISLKVGIVNIRKEYEDFLIINFSLCVFIEEGQGL